MTYFRCVVCGADTSTAGTYRDDLMRCHTCDRADAKPVEQLAMFAEVPA